MTEYNASFYPYKIIEKSNTVLGEVYPFLIDPAGSTKVYQVSPTHCRSFVVQHDDQRYVVSKGNGLSYTEHRFVHTRELSLDIWGLLYRDDALRDFYCGQEIRSLGIKTNIMEYVVELEYPVQDSISGATVKPCLLQYSVECPYRISDAAFMPKELIKREVDKWYAFNTGQEYGHLIAAEVLIHNLFVLHQNGILHNSLTADNHTWALELLDFEISRTPNYPYSKEDYERHVCDLYEREILDIYRIIAYIAGVLHEPLKDKDVTSIFEHHGFMINKLAID